MPLVPVKREGPELLDLPPETYGLDELEGSLADLKMVNRYLGDRRALLKHLSTKIAGRAEFTLLDIATGSADLPVTIAEWARREGIRAAITGVDINARTIDYALKEPAAYPEIKLQVADGLRLPFPDNSFDIVLCSKTSHHMTHEENVLLIKEMLRTARRGYLVMDLRRSWIAYALIYSLARLLFRNRLTRHDGPLSVLKAYTPGELSALALSAGAAQFTISREPFWLLVLSGDVA